MRESWRSMAALAALAMIVAACSSAETSGAPPGGSEAPDRGGAGDRASGDAPPGAAAARCVGKPVEAYTMGDMASCAKQGSRWNVESRTCEGTAFVVTCARADRDLGRLPEDVVREACLDMPGCGFTEADGTITRPRGRCEGRKIPCRELDPQTCGQQPGCIFYEREKCTAKNGLYYLDNADCPSLQIGDRVSFTVVRNACRRAMGCRWVE